MCGVELKIHVYLNEVSVLWGCTDCTTCGNNYCYIQIFYGQTDYEVHLQPVCTGGCFGGMPSIDWSCTSAPPYVFIL